MMKLEPGNIVLVSFPFSDLQSSKVRPAKGADVIILGIFSKVPEYIRNSWIIIDELHPAFKQSGLKKTSAIKTEKIAVIHQSLTRKKLGDIPPQLLHQVKQTLRRTLEIE
jgi:mRNA interferase MazF